MISTSSVGNHALIYTLLEINMWVTTLSCYIKWSILTESVIFYLECIDRSINLNINVNNNRLPCVLLLATTLWWNSYCNILLRYTDYRDYGQQWFYKLHLSLLHNNSTNILNNMFLLPRLHDQRKRRWWWCTWHWRRSHGTWCRWAAAELSRDSISHLQSNIWHNITPAE